MKILQLIQKPQLRGAEIFACQLATHLQQQGHEVLVVCLLAGDAQLPFTGKIVRLDRPLKNRFFDRKGWRALAQCITAFGPDIVQANAGDTLKYAALSRLFFGWKGRLVFRNANKVSDFINTTPKRLLNQFFLRRVDHVISVSELCRQDFVKTYGFPAVRTTTHTIGIEPVVYDTTTPQNLPADALSRKVLLNVGSMVPEKNQEALLRLTRALLDANQEVTTLIVGDGRLRSLLEQRIAALGLSNHVYLLGYRKDVLTLMAHADALVMPSRIEGLPGVILEAFYCTLPVVAYNVGGIGEVVKSGETGWLVAKDDEAALLQATQEALLSGPAVEAYTARAYDWVQQDFLNSAIAARFADTYQRIITQKAVALP
jgi:glycosyltransferase involved in cell wall biosynthesis